MTPDVRDTQQLHAITGRQPATIRTLCRHLRGTDGYAYPDALELLDSSPPDPIVLTPAEAWTYLGIRAERIRQWVHRKRIEPFDREGGVARYRADDLTRLRNREARRAQLDL